MIFAAALAALALTLPDPRTPGADNPAVTQATIAATICKPGWAATVRPPRDYTYRLKLSQLKAWGVAGKPHLYVEDHIRAIEDGGSPTDPLNLTPEPAVGRCGSLVKNRLELRFNRLICSGQMTLDAVRAEQAASTWVQSYSTHIKPLKCP